SDIGFCGVRPIRSQRFSSPIKNGEYLACGLPIIIPKGVSDDYLIVELEKIGLVFIEIEQISFANLLELKNINKEKIRKIAIQKRSLELVKKQYNNLLMR